MPLDIGYGQPNLPTSGRRRRRPAGPPDPIALALGERDQPAEQPGEGRFEPFVSDELDEDEGENDESVEALLAMLQQPADEQEGFGEEEEYRPLDEEGSPWGMDTDPGDADVLRNLLALRQRGLRAGRYPLQ